MSKGPEKGKKGKDQVSEPAADYYKLKTEAVEDLVTADEDNSPPVSKEELEQYGARKKRGIPNWLKVCFVKFWFPGSVCFFMFMGLGIGVPLDQIVIGGIVQGMVTDLLTNNMLRFIAQTDGSNDAWLMFPKKGYSTFPLNIVYAIVLSGMVFWVYEGVDAVINLATGTPGVKHLMIEPLSYGLFYMLCDNLLVAVKNGIRNLVTSRKNKNA